MRRCVLDTNVLGHYFRGDNEVIARMAQNQIDNFGNLAITIITYFEAIQGWEYLARTKNPEKRTRALRKISQLDQFRQENEILYLTVDACKYAARIYAERRAKGSNYHATSDILVAGIALANNYVVVTENEKDFIDIDGLSVENWLKISS